MQILLDLERLYSVLRAFAHQTTPQTGASRQVPALSCMQKMLVKLPAIHLAEPTAVLALLLAAVSALTFQMLVSPPAMYLADAAAALPLPPAAVSGIQLSLHRQPMSTPLMPAVGRSVVLPFPPTAVAVLTFQLS